MIERRQAPVTPLIDQFVTVSCLRDPTTVHDGFEFLDQDVVKLGNRPWLAKRVTVRLENLLVVYHEANCRTRTKTRIRHGAMAFVAFGQQARGTIDGLNLSPEEFLIAEPRARAELVVEAGYQSISCMILPDVLTGHLNKLGTHRKFKMPLGADLRRANGPACRTLFELGKSLTDTAKKHPSLFDNRQTRAAAQIELLETLLEMATGGESHQITARDRTRKNYSRIVMQAETYVMENKDARYYVSDLCNAAATSERTLQYAFQTIMDMTPVAFLRRVRLHRTRGDLLHATPHTTSVTAVALNWGFSHYGEFAHDYKTCFDELPSETLRNSPKSS